MKEARQLAALAKSRYPNIDIDEALKGAVENFSYLDELFKIQFDFGGPKSGRTIVKSCLAWAIQCGIKAHDCLPAMTYLRQDDGFPCFGYYYEKDLLVNRPPEIFHCVAVSGNSETKQLLGYAEYYGIYRIVVGLSDQYNGPNFSKTLAINPVSRSHLNIEIDLSLTKEDLIAAYNYEKIPAGALEKAADPVMLAGINNEFNREKDRVLKRAIKIGLEKCGAQKGELLTKEHMLKLTKVVTTEIMPFIMRHTNFRSIS